MEQNAQKNGIINLLVLLTTTICLYAVGQYSHSFAAQTGSIFLALGTLVAIVSLFQMRLEDRERLERLEFEEVAKAAGSSGLFRTEESESFPARRSREQFERFFVPGFTLILFLLQLIAAGLTWRWLSKPLATPLNQPLVALGLTGLFGLVLFLIGKYSAGLARLANQRLLRPSATYLLLGFYLCLLIVAAIAAYQGSFPALDLLLARAFSIALGLLALETLFGLVLDLYRPRVKGKVGLLLYESRVIGLLGQPQGLFKTAAHALDYQFGFKVSETWFFQFLQERIMLLLLGQLVILLLSTCFVFVETGDQALLERFGTPVQGRDVLDPGLHLKWPWPVDRVYRYTTGRIQDFYVGFAHDEKDEKQKAILWTVAHYKEEFNLIVASRDSLELTNSVNGKKSPPVNLLAASIPVQYQISDLRAWAYNNRDSGALLEMIGTRAVVRYLVGVDLHETMSTGRFRTGEELRQRIQAEADALNLGAKIIFVGLQDIHPPIKVASAYEAVVGARQKKEADILNAKAYQIRTNALATSLATVRVNDAEAVRLRTEAGAMARAALFTNQLPAYAAAPRTYAERAYLQTLVRSGGANRKIIMGVTNSQEVILLNLEEKIRADLLDIPLPRGR